MNNQKLSTTTPPTAKNGHETFIPPVPETFCFIGENFLSETFSVDGFVRRNSKRVHSLEKLKEHLFEYLKMLKQSMINLINEDYTEFINLSANLVSFDKSINNIKTPVIKFKNEAHNAKIKIDEVMISMNAKQERLKVIRDTKHKLNMILEIMEYLERVEANMERMDSIINLDKSSIYSDLNENSILIARLNMNFQCLLDSQKNIQLIDKLKQRFDLVSKKFYEILGKEVLFLLNYDHESLKQDPVLLNKFIPNIEQLFSIYLLDGNKQELVLLIRNHIVRPRFEEIILIKGNNVQMPKDVLERMFSQIIQFIENDCFQMIKALNTGKVFTTLKFELIRATIWDTFVDMYLPRVSFLLPDSETFQENYLATFKFIEEFLNKTCLIDYRTKFEQEPSFIRLKSKFKLNVYFHMKLKNISAHLENSFETYGYSLMESNSTSKFKLIITQIIHDQLMDCWRSLDQNQYYIGDLFIYLWKLTTKILARFATWISRMELNHIRTYFRLKYNNSLNESDMKRLIQQCLSCLIGDCYLLLEEFNSNILQKIIQPHWDVYWTTRLSHTQTFSQCSLKQSYDDVIKTFQTPAIDRAALLLKTEITDECKRVLDLVNDIPRLYRRTNKEKPKEASGYIYRCVEQLSQCAQMIGYNPSLNNNNNNNQWLQEILVDIAQHYKHLTLEVLTSVQKTEDSLKKLKKLKPGSGSGFISPSNAHTMSDDDKIRLQIYFDVQTFGEQIQNKFKIDLKRIKPYYELLETIESLKVLQ